MVGEAEAHNMLSLCEKDRKAAEVEQERCRERKPTRENIKHLMSRD